MTQDSKQPTPQALASVSSSTPPEDWRRWIPQLKEAAEEHKLALENLERAENEISRICYCLQRDRAESRKA